MPAKVTRKTTKGKIQAIQPEDERTCQSQQQPEDDKSTTQVRHVAPL
ncbi:hypothetical protein [Tunturibacter empetritectus]|uniref:Uncharacterized protein n=1 Tax=Tunturiibacter lichenicola TaxID=2051959 RepID=A0A7W8N4G4_9BACT|nr:hypothetical protein [Edaphobacter lichenicola]MBB5344493.1 hypothetical protein [Edaphobacter lichenicola]